MRKLLNTLYIFSENVYLSLSGETVLITENGKKLGQHPLHLFENIICFSYNGASPALMGKCAENGINLAFYSPFGKFLCRVTGSSRGNILLRKEQYRISDSKEKSCLIGRNFILGKLFNCRWSIDRTLRDHPLRVNEEKCRNAVSYLKNTMENVVKAENLDSLRGLEGEGTSLYFSVFDELILNQKEEFFFKTRNRRPPTDNVNAMLSFAYSILANDCAAAAEGVGLDSYAGFVHRDRPGRKSLALDMMEELRPVFADRFVISIVNNRQMKGEFFEKTASGAVTFTEEGKRKFLTLWQERKKEVITHPYLGEKMPWGLVPHVQALLLARHIRGDVDGYPPFLWK